MKFNELIEEIIKKCEELNLDSKPIVDKYTRRFQLAIEAGFTEEEAVNKFGTADEIIKQFYNVNNDSIRNMDFAEISVLSGDVVINEIPGNKINCILDKDIAKYYTVKIENNIFSLKRNIQYSAQRIPSGSKVEINIGKDIHFNKFTIGSASTDFKIRRNSIKCDELEISTVSGDCVVEELNSKNVYAHTVSGDLVFNNLTCNTLDLDTVSGDMVFKNVNANSAGVNTISGDISLTGKVNNIKTTAVSGDVSYNGEIVSHNIFKRRK